MTEGCMTASAGGRLSEAPTHCSVGMGSPVGSCTGAGPLAPGLGPDSSCIHTSPGPLTSMLDLPGCSMAAGVWQECPNQVGNERMPVALSSACLLQLPIGRQS